MPAIVTGPTPLAVSDIAFRVKRLFGDESGVQIDDTDILRWCNDGQLDIARKTQCLVKTQYYNTALGFRSIDPPVGFLYLDRATCNGRLLSSITVTRLDKLYPDREVTYPTGVPEYIAWTGSGFELYPAPDSVGTNNLVIKYAARPSTLLAITDSIEIFDQYYEALVKFCLMRANELNEDWNASGKYQKDYTDDVYLIRSDTNWIESSSYPVVRDFEEGGW